ncbi:bifunctional 2-polyprenyl-6-hydroxyphenol methylase/3-demethylubiquinol 3-O-methyltransferase UbiG [Marinoscillum sp. MHG1-6]|uniref:class I SAM-dependent methyltransferase n=1 Tax=Marinoscillum sp. MHG1-6 TaxID=2959627 RepID=UPI00215811D2|nr:class I SAM-dependent methyltransferase [Marinoscillum sp. MHG1-6]
MTAKSNDNQTDVAEAFGRQSVIFDQIYDANPIVSYMRERIRSRVLKLLNTKDEILEINAGTGTDAIYFARHGYHVTAIELSQRMVNRAQEKIQQLQLQNQVDFICKSFIDINELPGTYDFVYSNFGGLNCTPDIKMVLEDLISKLKPGGSGLLTILPPFTLWEKLFLLKGNTKIAFRRKFKGASSAHIEGQHFDCWYYTPQYVKSIIEPLVDQIQIEGLCIFSPPSFLEKFPVKYPKLYSGLTSIDHVVAKWPLFRSIGDYFIISFTK